jgi:type IV pilus secretin PilQ/predicted competence protein
MNTRQLSKINQALFFAVLGANIFNPATVLGEEQQKETPPQSRGIETQSSSKGEFISIPTTASAPKFSITQVSDPARVVLDIASGGVNLAASHIKTGDLKLASAVRIGRHPEVTRVVIDLRRGSFVDHSVEVLGSQLRVRLVPLSSYSKKASIASERASMSKDLLSRGSSELSFVKLLVKSDTKQSLVPASKESALCLASAKDLKESAGRLKAAVNEILTDGGGAAVGVTAVVKPLDNRDTNRALEAKMTGDNSPDKRPKVAHIALEEAESSSPSLAIRFSGDLKYTFNRTAPSEYVVRFNKTDVSEPILSQTIFAKPASSGIRSARVVTEGEDTLVRIFTQPSSYLSTRRSGGVLRVEETQDLARIAHDIRAQISPAAAADSSNDKDKRSVAAKDNPKTQPSPIEKNRKEPLSDDNKGGVKLSDSELAALAKSGDSVYSGRLISLDLQEADIDSALRIIAEVSNLNIVAGDGVSGKVTLKLVDVPWDQALDVILKSHGLDKVLEGNVLRVAPVDKLKSERESFKQARVAEEDLEPLSVQYIRVSYAKASEIRGLVETILTERGSVAFDERSNQLVVKDTRKGLQNVVELIKKVDLRTPQVLLETQIIEANRNISRQLGAELGFQYIQSPATGNGTGLNFPSAIAIGGSADPANSSSITGSAFPVPSTASLGSAVTMLFDSADGTKSLALRLSQLEQEGQVRIISKPAVATTNNKAAEIKSVEKYRVKLPNGGLSIASGSGASSSGSGDVATQTIEAGIILNVTPQASPDYYILLDIRAKSSSFGAKSVDGIPNEIERSASSSVLVSSGQTFALGGIYKINEQDRVSGVPFFKDIPIIGTLFRNTVTESSDEELLFFITPRIVEGSFENPAEKVV